MARTSTTRYAVLGALTLGPMTGYRLRQTIEGSIGHFWHESFGQLYPTLRTLEGEGLLSADASPDGRGREHRLTPAGRDALRRWLAEPPSSAAPHRSELLLKVFLARHAPPGAVARHLREHRATLAAARDRYAAVETALGRETGPDRVAWLATLRHGTAMVEAGLRWTDETLASLEEADA